MSNLAMFGFLAIDKPAGITSRTAMDRVSRLIRPVKVGHAGTLDPLATGVLVLCLGPATRLVSLVQSMTKTYRARFRLGFESETEDITSPLIPVGQATEISEAQLRATLENFEGIIQQQPPQYSALRLNGQRAYDLARAGKTFELKPREIQVDQIQLISFSDGEFEIDVVCGSGTYIRSLGRDIGRSLNCGAVMTALQRTSIGPFSMDDATDIRHWNHQTEVNQISERLHSPTESLRHGLGLCSVTLLEAEIADIVHGRRLNSLETRLRDSALTPEVPFMGVDAWGRLIAILRRSDDPEKSHSAAVSVEVNFSTVWKPVNEPTQR